MAATTVPLPERIAAAQGHSAAAQPVSVGQVGVHLVPYLEQQAEDAYDSFVKREPVLAASLAGSGIGWVLTFLVVHGVITSTQASSLTQAVLPAATAGILTGFGLVVRRFVSPAWKRLTGHDLGSRA